MTQYVSIGDMLDYLHSELKHDKDSFTEWEQAFIKNVWEVASDAVTTGVLSSRQVEVINKLYRKYL